MYRLHWLKATQAIALAIAICLSLGFTSGKERFNNLSHRMTCPCGCTELLGECNHVGCPDSGPMTEELTASINTTGKTDQQILDAFAAKYGATVLAAPTTKGFDLVAWIAPFAVFLAAMLGTVLVAKQWKSNPGTAPVQNTESAPGTAAIREQIRRETGDGGF